jgi:hypothetical protein
VSVLSAGKLGAAVVKINDTIYWASKSKSGVLSCKSGEKNSTPIIKYLKLYEDMFLYCNAGITNFKMHQPYEDGGSW